MNQHKLFLKQLDRQLITWQQTKKFFQPPAGWTNCLRSALGMTLPQLAKRLGVSRSRVVKIQQAEVSGALTVNTLKEVANAMNCDLVYGFIPRKSLNVILKERAEKIATQKLQNVSHSMALEDQKVEFSQQQEQWNDLVNTLLDGAPKHLWDENIDEN